MKQHHRVLFLVKLGHDSYSNYDTCGYSHSSASGLRNSARFVVDMLNRHGVEARLVQVVDNNDIDREVHKYQPTEVVLEAFWVVPEKFDVLSKLHPKVKWIIRCHSDWTFLASEGVAVEWIKDYIKRPSITVSFNSPNIVRDFRDLFRNWQDKRRIIYLPNYYPVVNVKKDHHSCSVLRVASFGAVRPLKNILIQAVAAIRYADITGRDLDFYMNTSRCEQGGEGTLRNVRALFKDTRHTLIETPWIDDHDTFLSVMKKMDYSLCVSLSETFCITAADSVVCNVPLVCSDEIPWASSRSIVDTNDSDEIVAKMGKLTGICGRLANRLNRISLSRYARKSKELWLNFLNR